MDLLLTLLIVQAVMGAFDTIYHHELTVALPAQASARSELKVHALRSIIYGIIFAGLAWFVFGGWRVVLLWTLVIIEVVLTLIDFLIEDHTRMLPQSERVLHTLLAIGGGAAFTVLALQTPAWWELPTELAAVDYAWKSWFLTLATCGVTLSGVRDALAARTLAHAEADAPLNVGAAHLRFLIAGGTGFHRRRAHPPAHRWRPRRDAVPPLGSARASLRGARRPLRRAALRPGDGAQRRIAAAPAHGT